MEKIEKLRDYFNDIKFYMGELRDNKQALKDIEERYTSEMRAMSLKDNFNSISDKLKENQDARKLNDTMINILLQDVLYIQQQLLLHASEFIKTSKFFGKPFGEKTKEKMQNELKEYLTDAMGGITLYCYINRKQDYYDDVYEINIYFEDFYYEYDLKQDYIRVKVENKETIERGYWQRIDFIDFVAEKLEDNAKKMLDDYKKATEEMDALAKQMKAIREKNNEGKTAFLHDLYIDNTLYL